MARISNSSMMTSSIARLTSLALTGQIAQVGDTLFRPQDMLLDAALGGALAGLGYGVG
jgi:hypothetical protein